MDIKIIKCLDDNYSYLLIDKINSTCCVVDPGEPEVVKEIIKKKKLKLNFILNTHHHFDHVGGNIVLKKEFGAKVLGYSDDKNRIPGIDIFLNHGDVWEEGNFKAKIFHIPGHTSGHICFNFFEEKILFTGDTLFSLGCGRVFEGTYSQMLNSLNLIKKFPPETKVYFGHEYTQNNLNFCKKYDTNNSFLKDKEISIKSKLKINEPTTPVSLEEELRTNIFLRCNDKLLKSNLGLNNASEEQIFKKLRDLKDSF